MVSTVFAPYRYKNSKSHQIALEQGSSPDAAPKSDLKMSFLFASGSSTHTVPLL